MNSRSFFLSSLIAGIVIGLLGNLPVLNLINCCLCIWVWAGGLLAVLLYRRYEHDGSALTPAQGAGLGAFAGLIGAFVGVIVYALTSFISAPLFDNLARALDIQDAMPWQSGGVQGLVVSTLFFLVVDLIAYPLFGALSGLITASVLKPPAQVQSS